MPDPSSLRDSTQIVLPQRALDEVRHEVQARFTVTVQELDDTARIIASPVVIKELTDFLVQRGVPVE